MGDWMYTMYDMPEPEIIPRTCGGFLAVAPKWAAFRIGVTAPTETAAKDKFFESYAAWRSYFIPAIEYEI